MDVAPSTTWLFVSTSPDEVTTIPVPAVAPFWDVVKDAPVCAEDVSVWVLPEEAKNTPNAAASATATTAATKARIRGRPRPRLPCGPRGPYGPSGGGPKAGGSASSDPRRTDGSWIVVMIFLGWLP